jgi:hypothetical protein
MASCVAAALILTVQPAILRGQEKGSPKISAIGDEGDLSLRIANIIHVQFRDTCSWTGCRVRYEGDLGRDMPSKVFVPGRAERNANVWTVYWSATPDGPGRILLTFRIDPGDDREAVAKLVVGKKAFHAKIIEAYDNRGKTARGDQRMFDAASPEDLRELTPNEMIRRLVSFRDPLEKK